MHFWIDKRSPQCGFGRSRVAASLSGVGGSGVSFGHPPRRSGGSKSSSSSNAGIAVHRQQQHHHQAQHQQHTQQQQHPQHQQTQYHQHATAGAATPAAAAVSGTSTTTTVTGVGATGAAITTNSNNPNYRSSNYASTSTSITHSNNNNNSQTSGSVPSTSSSLASSTTNQTPTNRNYVRPTNTTSSHHHYNNNRQQQYQQQQPGSQQQSNPHLPNSSSNNNHSTTCNTTATTTTVVTQNVTSPTGNNLSSPYAVTQTASSVPGASTQPHHLQQQHPYQQQRYRHPQFGNMSVRTYQPTAHHQQQQQQQTLGTNAAPNQQSSESTLNALNESSLPSQSLNQTANISTTELYQSSPRVVSVFPRHLPSNMATATCDHTLSGTATTATLTNLPNASRTMYGGTATHTSGGGNSRRRTVTRSIESADLQFLPLHLKCGIFASLVLAIAFIVGIKVYFDNQGTKFEVGLFWLLTATFVFAFCFVSICKVPRVLFAASSTSSRSGSRDQTVRDRCSMDDTRGGSVVNSIDDVVVSGLHEFQQQEQMQQQQQQQQIGIGTQQQPQHPVLAGPPPYHIAILLPESKVKEEIEQLEESPPPSYDKILI